VYDDQEKQAIYIERKAIYIDLSKYLASDHS